MDVLGNLIDEQGFIIDPVIVETTIYTEVDGEVIAKEKEIPSDIIIQAVPEGFYTPRWDFETSSWVEGRDSSEILKEKKAEKFKEVSELCKQSILGYFDAEVDGITYQFSFDDEAQRNFTGALALFNKGIVPSVEWTAWQDGIAKRIILAEPEFLSIVLLAFAHKDSKIARFRNEIQGKIESASTIEEIESIEW